METQCAFAICPVSDSSRSRFRLLVADFWRSHPDKLQVSIKSWVLTVTSGLLKRIPSLFGPAGPAACLSPFSKPVPITLNNFRHQKIPIVGWGSRPFKGRLNGGRFRNCRNEHGSGLSSREGMTSGLQSVHRLVSITGESASCCLPSPWQVCRCKVPPCKHSTLPARCCEIATFAISLVFR